MRAASWVFVMCAVLSAVGVFLPSIELEVRGSAVSKRTEVSLYKAASDRELARRLLTVYRGSEHRRVGGEIIRTVSPRVGGRTRTVLADARDAMETLDTVSDDDARIAGIVLVAVLVALLGLEAIMAGLVFGELVRGSFRRGRFVAALIVAVLASAVAVAIHLACREAVWQANDEVGRTLLALGPGSYVIAGAAIAGLLVAIAIVSRFPARYTVRTRVAPR